MKSGRSVAGGRISIALLAIILVSVVGYMMSLKLIHWSGPAELIRAVPFFASLMGLFLTPLYALYRQLADLKKVSKLTATEKVRVDEVVDNRMFYLVLVALYYLIGAGYMISARFWPVNSELSIFLARIGVVIVLVGVVFVVQTFIGFIEAHRFEAKLERRHQADEEKKRLLDQLTTKKT